MSPSSVPPELTGLWRRELITTPHLSDTTTQVVWLQTSSWYVDLRVPEDTPAADGRTTLACFKDDELRSLARIEGFAGELSVGAGVCAWRRDLDRQPPAATPDEGRFALQGDVMIEDGIHLPYREVWRREPMSQRPLLAFRRDADLDGREGLLMIGGDHLLEFVTRPGPPPKAGATLADLVAEALAAGRRQEALTLLMDRIRYARWVEGRWETQLCSLPWMQAAVLDRFRFDRATDVLTSADGADRWRLLDAIPGRDAVEDRL